MTADVTEAERAALSFLTVCAVCRQPHIERMALSAGDKLKAAVASMGALETKGLVTIEESSPSEIFRRDGGTRGRMSVPGSKGEWFLVRWTDEGRRLAVETPLARCKDRHCTCAKEN